MAFWGVEVKPGKPVIHSCEKAIGRLRISQATLGISEATKKSIVQCNVGKKSPVLLCALLPNQTESCHLDLEFEEADDVVFSVIGPRSVYLTGYYIRQNQKSGHQSDSESYGVDIQNSQTEESSYQTDGDEYEDSFIDDDEEPQSFSPSPVSRSKEDETASESDKPNNAKGRRGRLIKKCQVVVSEDDSEDDDGFLLSIFKSKKSEKTNSTGVEGNIVNQNVPANNGKDQMHSLDRNEGYNVHKEDKMDGVEASKNLDIEDHQLGPELASDKCRKSKRRRKQLHSEVACKEEIDVKSENVAEDDYLVQNLFHTESKKVVTAANVEQKKQIDNDISIKAGLLDTASQPEKKIKKKTKKKKKDQGNGESDMGFPDTANHQEIKPVKSENYTSNTEPTQNRTLSNGLVIEEVANGPPDGKVASRGKKVKIFYTAILKENGHIFDSNVGKSPCKFRLGNEGIIDGWNLGIEGMHVGDVRRLIVPPSMGFGKHGAGENVPPDSWLVYDVELAGVSR
ncbi:hypothetical protein SASPL_106090 [Salvia splendens]|uniref:peptidylprolyl isomerase n=1 Tax=Salvia splendens TaxID=180675 RepID=A0A8X8YMY0_SALSN|nr:hypothetical protein SASPL_106090 [Salvia splendens]